MSIFDTMGDTHKKINGEEIELSNGRRINIKVIDALLHQVLEESAEEWYESYAEDRHTPDAYTIQTSEVQSLLYRWYDMDISTETIRRNGFSKGGALENTYEYFTYNKIGDPKHWGMRMNFVEYLEDKGKLEEMQEKYDETDDSESNVPDGRPGVKGYDY